MQIRRSASSDERWHRATTSRSKGNGPAADTGSDSGSTSTLSQILSLFPRPHDEQPVVTSMVLRNISPTCTRLDIERALDAEGFQCLYDFIYLPLDLCSGASFGYAFINLTNHTAADDFSRHFNGFKRWPAQGSKHLVVHACEVLQGLDQHVERYRNSPLMHSSVADKMRPATYRGGVREPFPEPTIKVKMPRKRSRHQPRGALRTKGTSQACMN